MNRVPLPAKSVVVAAFLLLTGTVSAGLFLGQNQFDVNGGDIIDVGRITFWNGELALGEDAAATGEQGVSMGQGANASANYSVVIGVDASSPPTFEGGHHGIAIGRNAFAVTAGTAIGYNASAASGVAVGWNTSGREDAVVAVGPSAYGGGWGGVTLGYRSKTEGEHTTAVGQDSEAVKDAGTAIGHQSTSNAENGTAIGAYAEATGPFSFAGGAATVSGSNSIAVGKSSIATGSGSIALGQNANASADESVAIGKDATVNSANTVKLGSGSTSYGLTVTGSTTLQSLVTVKDRATFEDILTLSAVSLPTCDSSRDGSIAKSSSDGELYYCDSDGSGWEQLSP